MNHQKTIQTIIHLTQDMLKAASHADVEKILTLDVKRKAVFSELPSINKNASGLELLEEDYKRLLKLNNELSQRCINMKSSITSNMQTLQQGKHASNAYTQNQY